MPPSPSGRPVAAASLFSFCSDSAHSRCRLHWRSQGPCKNKGVSVTPPIGHLPRTAISLAMTAKQALRLAKPRRSGPLLVTSPMPPRWLALRRDSHLLSPSTPVSSLRPVHRLFLPVGVSPCALGGLEWKAPPLFTGSPLGPPHPSRQPSGVLAPEPTSSCAPSSVTCFHLPYMLSAGLSFAITYGT